MAKFTIDILVKNSRVEQARQLWSDEYNGGVLMTNTELRASVESFVSEMIAGQFKYLLRESIKKEPEFIGTDAV